MEKDAEAEEQDMEMFKKRRTGVKFPGEKSFDGAHGTLFVWKTQCHTVLNRDVL